MKVWLKCASIRAVKTFCQTAIATIGTSKMIGEVSWEVILSTSGLAFILSILTSMAGLPEAKEEDNANAE